MSILSLFGFSVTFKPLSLTRSVDSFLLLPHDVRISDHEKRVKTTNIFAANHDIDLICCKRGVCSFGELLKNSFIVCIFLIK
jgi:hypothetical protein